VAAALGLGILWVQWPRPPVFDGERWFKALLISLIQGRVDASGGHAVDFDARVLRFVPYHPAGRFPERKALNPAASITGPALDGERALCEALAALPTPEARLRYMYDQDEIGFDARVSDPAELGAAYDPATAMGPDASWDAVAAWGEAPGSAAAEALRAAIARSLPARWVLVGGTGAVPSVLDALAEAVPTEVSRIDGSEGPDAVMDALDALVDETPLVLVGEDVGTTWILAALPEHALLRERTLAVVSVGGVIGGRSDVDGGPLSFVARRDWLAAHFRMKALETDVVRLTPYFAVQWLDPAVVPPGIAGLPLESMRFPEPPEDASASTVEVVDLGPLYADPESPVDLVARALVVTVAAWVANRR